MQRSYALIIPNHLPYVRLAEAEHHVEVRVEGERCGDVVAAGDVVHGHGTHAHHEYAVEIRLEELEHVAVESLGVCHCMIYLLPCDVQDCVCEVVVLINDEIEVMSKLLGPYRYDVQL